MLDINSIAIDPELARKGVWADYMGGSFLLARRGPEHDARLGQLYNENETVIKQENEEGTRMLSHIYQRAFCDTILLDWKNVGVAGKAIKFSPDEAMKIISDPRFTELAVFLEKFSLHHSNYTQMQNSKVAKNVKNSAAS